MPIQKNTKAEVLRTIRRSLRAYRFFEVWLDRVADRDDLFIDRLRKMLGSRLVIVARGQEVPRDILTDIDIASAPPAPGAKVIASYHNYRKTPDDRTLRKIIARMDAYQPVIYKIATYCNSPEDALRLLNLLLELKKRKKKYIIVGMGEHGAMTRIYGALWGNELVFAPRTLSERSAPGQLTKNQMEKIINT